MITPVVINETQKVTARLEGAAKQGQWVNVYASNTSAPFTENQVEAVNAAGDTQLAAYQLFPVMTYPADREGPDSDYETIADGSQVVILRGADIEIEDDKLLSRVPGANFSGASVDAAMYLTVSGYPTLLNDVGYVGSSTIVARFVKLENGIVTYRTV